VAKGWQTNRKLNAIVLAISCCIIVVGLLLMPYMINYFFSPDELIRNTTRALENLTGSKIKIRSAKLSLVEGITFYDVQVLVPPEKLKLEPRFQSDDGRILRADSFQIKLRRDGLFGLKLHIEQILINNPAITLVKLSPQNHWNFHLLFEGSSGKESSRRTFKVGPPVTIQNGRFTLTQIKDNRRITLGNIGFSAQATPRTSDQVYYDLQLSTWTAQTKGPAVSIDFNPQTGEILAGKLETISIKSIEQTLPEPCKSWIRQFNLDGKITISEVEHIPNEKTRLILSLDQIRTNVPLSKEELHHPGSKSYLHLSDLTGKIIFTRKEVVIPKLAGKLNNAPCQIKGTFKGYTTDPNHLGFNLHVICQQLACLDYTDPDQHEYIEKYMPDKLRKFFRDFKPKGTLSLDLLINKKPTPDAKLTLAGKIQPNRCSAEYYKFPYRLNDLTGTVQLANGGFKLIDMTGHSGGGKAVVNGTISEPSQFAEINLEIVSTRTPLDKKLYDTLSPRYQQLWNKFALAGAADTKVTLYQPYGMNQPWHKKIQASLVNASGCYEHFKFPLKNLSGSLVFENDRLDLHDIKGKNNDTDVTINGVVCNFEQPSPLIQLQLTAHKVDIAPPIVDQLPPQSAKIIQECKLAGQLDLNGTLNIEPNKPIDYDFLCNLKNSTLCYKDFPYPIKPFTAQTRVTPRDITINHLSAVHGTQTIQGTGKIQLLGPQSQISLKINADNLVMDTLLYQALDSSQKPIWDMIKPTGEINVQAILDRDSTQKWNWKIDLDLQKSAIRYQSLPALSDLTGHISFIPHQAILRNLKGKTSLNGLFETDGLVKNENGITNVNLTRLNIDQLPVTDGLIAQFADTKLVADLKPQPGGTIACNLKDIIIQINPDKKQSCDLAGRLAFQNVHLDTFDPNPTDAEYTGRLTWNTANADLIVEGEIDLKSFMWNKRRIQNIYAALTKKTRDPMLNIAKLRGQLANGQISGLGKMKIDSNQTTYGLQLTLDNLDAASVLNLDPHQKSINGKLRGELYMHGTLGQKYVRMGGGTLEVTGAEVLKIPLFAEIYHSASNNSPNLASFHDITAQFILEQHKVNIQHVELVGPAISLIGQGNLNISNDRINLSLVAATPKNLNNLPVIPDLMKGASREFTEMEIRGTLDHPTITAKPLSNISETLQTFFNGKTVH